MAPPIWEQVLDPLLLEQSATNFDFPAASSSNAPSTSPPDSSAVAHDPSYPGPASLRHLREFLNSSEGGRDRRARDPGRPEQQGLVHTEADDSLRERQMLAQRRLDVVAAEENDRRRETQRRRASILGRSRRPRRIHDSPAIQRQTPPFVTPTSPSSSMQPRTRARFGSRYLQRQRIRADSRHSSSLTGLREAGARLAEASSSLSALLDEPMPRLVSPDVEDFLGEGEINRWRAKRRRLDSAHSTADFQGFSYGHYGQVVPGPLKLEIYSCDGGAYSEPFGDMSGVENVLVDDTSVYCTKTDVCNIILQHQAQTTFDLRKLVIKSPQNDFDAPIQEGMVFISMRPEDLLTRTAQYQIRYTSTSQPRDSYDDRRANTRHSRLSAVGNDDPLLTQPDHRRSTSTDVIDIPYAESESDLEDQYQNLLQDARIPSFDRHPTPAPDAMLFSVTADFEDKSDAEDDGTRQEAQSYPPLGYIRTSWLSPYPRLDSDSSDSEDDDHSDVMNNLEPSNQISQRYTTNSSRRLQQDHHRASARGRNIPSVIQPAPESGIRVDHDAQEDPQVAHPDVMVPHARFFIERHKSMISLKFDPPVSGRFMLIKLWSPYSGGNIDIQSIIAHGFAGPRFFPALEMR